MDYFEHMLTNLREDASHRICIIGDFIMPNIKWTYIDSSNSDDGIKFCDLISSHFSHKSLAGLQESHKLVKLHWVCLFLFNL